MFNYKGYDCFPYKGKYKELICENCGKSRGKHATQEIVQCMSGDEKHPIYEPTPEKYVKPTKKGYPKVSDVVEKEKVVPIEDLVKTAIKEAIAKRGLAEGSTIASPEVIKEALVEPEPEPIKLELKPGQVWSSKLFGKSVRFGKHDFPVTVFKPEDFDEVIRPFIPKIDPT